MAVSGLATEPLTFVTLKGGLVVPLEALELAWSLEGRGAVFAVEGDQLVVDAPSTTLTPTDRAGLRRWKHHLIAIVSYRPRDAEAAQ
jgi:hypothetical protein